MTDYNNSYVLVNGLRFHYLHWDLSSGGVPVVLLHGLASNARIWELVAPYLVQNGFDPIAVDLRGHGLSDKPEEGYDFDAFYRDLTGFIDQLHLEHPILAGHSFGGMVAVDFAARSPFGSSAPSGLILVDGGITQLDQLPGSTWETISRRLAPPRLAGTPLEDFLSYWRSPKLKWHPDDEQISIYLGNFEVDDQELIYPHLSFDHHMQILRAMWDWKGQSLFPRLRCPVLAAPVRPTPPFDVEEIEFLELKEKGIRRAQETIQNLRVEWMNESVHDIPLQKPLMLANVMVDFCKNLG
ncbi:MAG: alpha/beta hydrolase [Chloroflexi bacterium]|nr:MAG: alpha/beta hydrolase [Chloroflexota bacterium]